MGTWAIRGPVVDRSFLAGRKNLRDLAGAVDQMGNSRVKVELGGGHVEWHRQPVIEVEPVGVDSQCADLHQQSRRQQGDGHTPGMSRKPEGAMIQRTAKTGVR